MASCWSLSGLILVSLALIASAISCVAPYWIYQVRNPLHVGLWGYCKHEDCTWFFQKDFAWETKQPIWVKICQGLFGFGLLTLIIAFFMACVHLCCRCCGYFCITNLVSGLLLLSFLEIAVAIGLYGGKGNEQFGFNLKGDLVFNWGYWIGCVGAGLNLIAAFFYLCGGCRNRGPEGYQRGEPV